MPQVLRGLVGACIIASMLAVAPGASSESAAPSSQTNLRFDWGAGVSGEDRALIEDATRATITAFDARFNQSAGVLTVYVTSDDGEWEAAQRDYLGAGYRPGLEKTMMAFPEAILIPTDDPRWNKHAGEPQRMERDRWGGVFHEYAHVLQSQNAGVTRATFSYDSTPPSFEANPRWLVEGGAQDARKLIEHDLGWNCYDQGRQTDHTLAMRQAAPRLDEISTREGAGSHADFIVTAELAADFLMTRHGNWAILSPGNYSSWQDPSEFSAAYESQRDAGFPFLQTTSLAACGAAQANPATSSPTVLRFDWGAGVSSEDRVLIEDATRTAIAAFDARFNLVATTLTVYATSNDQEWDDATTDYLGHPYCCGKGIVSFPEAIFVATDVAHWTMEPSWGSKERNQMGAVFHEYAHVLQYQNAGLTRANTDPCEGDCFWMGPRWLVEGGAEFTRSLVEHDLEWSCYDGRRTMGHSIAELQAAPRPEDISTRAGFGSHPDAMITAPFATDFLATRHGNSAPLYPGNFSSWADPAAFYAAYETERQAGFTFLDHTSVAPCQNAAAGTQPPATTSSPPVVPPSPPAAAPSPVAPSPPAPSEPAAPVPAISTPLLLLALLLVSLHGQRRKT